MRCKCDDGRGIQMVAHAGSEGMIGDDGCWESLVPLGTAPDTACQKITRYREPVQSPLNPKHLVCLRPNCDSVFSTLNPNVIMLWPASR